MNFLPPKKRINRIQDLKNRILKNREPILDIMAKNIKGARACPFLLGQKCLGELCEHFLEFKTISDNGKEFPFWRCAHVQLPLLIIELIRDINLLKEEVRNVKIDKKNPKGK